MSKEPAVQVMRRQVGAALLGVGLAVALLGAKPEWFRLSLSPAIGLIQLLTLLFGLGLAALGAYLRLLAAWHADGVLPLRADLGVRIAATGYILIAVAALADILGFGSHPNPKEAYFGPWQRWGMGVGFGVLVAGFLLALPWRRLREENDERTHGGYEPQSQA